MNGINQTDLYVILIGMAIVFIGLVCIILLCKIMSALCGISSKMPEAASPATAAAQAPVAAQTPAPAPANIPNRAQFIAAVSAVIAEEIGEDASSIRILSVKKL